MRLALLVLPALLLLSSCSQFRDRPPVQVAVFSQGSDMDLPKSVFQREIGGKTVTLKVIPEFTQDSIVAFHSFAADNGTQGICLQLDVKGRNALEVTTRLRQGEILASVVNGSVVDFVKIDNTVSNGLFTIWRGIPAELVTKMDEFYPRIQTLKQSGGDSSASSMDMTPSTSSEKKEAFRRSRERAKPQEAVKPGTAVPLSKALQLQ